MTTKVTKNGTKATKPRWLFVTLFVTFVVFIAADAQSPDQPLPRFRGGANLVTVDAYFTSNGVPVTDLKPGEVEVLEDDRPQAIDSFRLVRASGAGLPAPAPEPGTPAAERDAAAAPEARVFVVFFDLWHVSFDGSARSAAPVSAFLTGVIGGNDLVGMMTPEMPARSLPLTRRVDAVDRIVRSVIDWGERDKAVTSDPREAEIQMCYPDHDLQQPQFRGVAKEMIERRRERKTLQALDDLVSHLGSLRDERKFVVLLSEGWVQFERNDRLGAALVTDSVPGMPGVGVTGDGRITTGDRLSQGSGLFDSCERERVLLAFLDHDLAIRQLTQKANRANVTFYAVDPRGLAAFDDSIGPLRPATPAADRERMTFRQTGLRELAGNTDGAVVLNTNDVKGGVERIMADLSSYYLMQYYSTNTALDGRFRRLTVRVKRPGVQVRARAGYLAPTEAEARAMTAPANAAGAAPPAVTRALDVLRRSIAAAANSSRMPAAGAAEGPAMIVLRRGPSTGLTYVATTDPRFRRTERLRMEVPIAGEGLTGAGRVLTREGQALPLVVTFGTRNDAATGRHLGVAAVTLAPLAAGDYVLELSLTTDGRTELVAYGFRIVP